MKINNTEYKLKYTFRALMLFEQITNKMFTIETFTDQLIFFYCILVSSNTENTLTYDQFMNALDDNPSLLQDFKKFLITEIYQTLVIQCGISPDYVLDNMQMYEVQPLIQSMHLKYKESWEQSRMISYIMAQVNSTKTLKPTDIIKFAWDEESNSEETNKVMSDGDIKRLRLKAQEYLQKVNTNG